jgi:hypothetical protein
MTEEQALQALAQRRASGIPDLRAELRQRIAELGSMALNTRERRNAVAEVIAAFEVAPFDLLVDPAESMIDTADELLHTRGALVERQPGGGLRPVALIDRLFDFSAGTVEHAYLEVMSDYRDRRIAPRLMLQSLALYDRLNLAHITVHAGLQSGRFYWAGRVGFDFVDEVQRRHVERWATYVLGALRIGQDLDGVTEPQQWALLGTEVDPAETTSFEELGAALPDRLPLALLDPNGNGVVGYVPAADVGSVSGTVDTAEHLRLIREGNSLTEQDRVPIGKAIMLTGPDWYGIFDLSDTVRRREYKREALAGLARSGIAFP